MKNLKNETHIKVLDGWRGVSIVLVLLAHLVPLPGPKALSLFSKLMNGFESNLIDINVEKWNFNNATGAMGMVIFFNLSGFLITNFLLSTNATASGFLIRRFFRIIPLVWLYIIIVFLILQPSTSIWIANLLFYANLPPKKLLPYHDHLWSICVEIQFYLGITILFFFFKQKGLQVLPYLAIFFTSLRIYNHSLSSSITYFRIDEILAGCALALLLNEKFGNTGKALILVMKKLPQILFLLLLYISSFEQSKEFNYFRPYISALLIGSTIYSPSTSLSKFLSKKILHYLASISYSLYILHLGLTETWLGQGDIFIKYLKRPLLLAVLFMLAHLSTFTYESRWSELGRKISKRMELKVNNIIN